MLMVLGINRSVYEEDFEKHFLIQSAEFYRVHVVVIYIMSISYMVYIFIIIYISYYQYCIFSFFRINILICSILFKFFYSIFNLKYSFLNPPHLITTCHLLVETFVKTQSIVSQKTASEAIQIICLIKYISRYRIFV